MTGISGFRSAPATPTLPEAEDESPRSLLCLGSGEVGGLQGKKTVRTPAWTQASSRSLLAQLSGEGGMAKPVALCSKMQ